MLSHDEIVKALKNINSSPLITWAQCVALFIASMSSFPRGCSTIISFLYAKQMEQHPIHSRLNDDKLCLYCGVSPKKWYEKLHVRYCLYTGRIWTNPICYLIDLEEWNTLTNITPTEEDRNILHKLVTSIYHAEEKESVSKLEKRIRSEKIFPTFYPGRVRDTLDILSRLGIMPSNTLSSLYDNFITLEDELNVLK